MTGSDSLAKVSPQTLCIASQAVGLVDEAAERVLQGQGICVGENMPFSWTSLRARGQGVGKVNNKGAARPSRNQSQNSLNAETRRDAEKRREREPSAKLCESLRLCVKPSQPASKSGWAVRRRRNGENPIEEIRRI